MGDSSHNQNDAVSCPHCGLEIAARPLEEIADTPCGGCQNLIWFLTEERDGIVELTFLPGLMLAAESESRIEQVLSAIGDAQRVLINLRELRILPSMFLGMLVSLQKNVGGESGALRICGLQEAAGEVIGTTKLDKVFDIYPDRAAALVDF